MKQEMRLYRPTWKAENGERKESSRWWLDFTDGNRRRLRLPGLSDRRQTEALARNVERLLNIRQSGDALPADMLKWLEAVPADFRQRLADAGLIDKDRAGGMAALMVLDENDKITGGHLADFLADAQARNVSPVQVHMLGQRCRDVLRRAGAKWLRDLSAASIQAAIAALTTATKEHPDGLSKQSLCHYVRAVKQFSKWLQRERRTAEDMLLGVKSYNVETDKRHERRGFTADEMDALLNYTAAAPARWNMTAQARAVAYRLAFSSGLRRNEIRTLTARSFDLDADPPIVTVQAGYSKRKRLDVQPLPADVADILAGYLADADPARPFALPDKSADMLRADMADARAKWIAQDGLSDRERQARQEDPDFLMPRDSRELVLDFHSFRHGYVTGICRAEVSPRVMMELCRHSDPRLTMKRYSRVTVSESAKALDALPRLAGPADDRQEQRATGTYGAKATATATATATPAAPGCPQAGDQGQGRLSARLVSSADSEAGPCGLAPAQSTPETPAPRFAKSFAKSCGLDGGGLVDSHRRNAENADGAKPLKTRGKAQVFAGNRQQAPLAQLDRASVYGTEG